MRMIDDGEEGIGMVMMSIMMIDDGDEGIVVVMMSMMVMVMSLSIVMKG